MRCARRSRRASGGRSATTAIRDDDDLSTSRSSICASRTPNTVRLRRCDSGVGAAGTSDRRRSCTAYSIPVPPLPEQQRIVGILDEAFEGIATAKANAEKNLQNARALFESHLQSVFTQRGKGWVEKTARARSARVSDSGSSSTDPLKTRSSTGEYPFIMPESCWQRATDADAVSTIIAMATTKYSELDGDDTMSVTIDPAREHARFWHSRAAFA